MCISLLSLLRNLKTHYQNVNLQRDWKGRYELLIPRYHELVPKQAEKEVSIEYCVCVGVGACTVMGVVTGAVSFDRGGDAGAAGHLLTECSD